MVDQKREALISSTWEQFKELFTVKYSPQVEIERITDEFLSLKQTTETILELNALFLEKARFCPAYMAYEKMKKYRYTNVLKTEIREFVDSSKYQTVRSVGEITPKNAKWVFKDATNVVSRVTRAGIA